MEFSSQEYWSELPYPSPGDQADPRTKSPSPVFHHCATWEAPLFVRVPIYNIR